MESGDARASIRGRPTIVGRGAGDTRLQQTELSLTVRELSAQATKPFDRLLQRVVQFRAELAAGARVIDLDKMPYGSHRQSDFAEAASKPEGLEVFRRICAIAVLTAWGGWQDTFTLVEADRIGGQS